MNIGYMRISTSVQNLDSQKDALIAAGCDRIFEDVASGAKSDRQGLKDCLEFARKGDVIVCWKLDRIGRSVSDLVGIINSLKDRGIGFRCLTQNIDTTTANGMFFFNIFASVAEFERDLIRERTALGLEAARARGRLGGRPRKLDASKVEMAKQLYEGKKTPVSEICQMLNCSKPTLYKYLKAA